ncbi:MAG: hypothetical protein NVSMB55_15130 [Mycobacteriales bacterium]
MVFLSGRGAGDDLVQALREGAHDYLRKPPEAAELLARVGAAIRLWRSGSERPSKRKRPSP